MRSHRLAETADISLTCRIARVENRNDHASANMFICDLEDRPQFAGDQRPSVVMAAKSTPNAEYERENYQMRTLPEMRILADSVSSRAAGLAAMLAGQIGGAGKTRR